jgi:hypothetical protein
MVQTIGGRGSGVGARAGGRHLFHWRRLRTGSDGRWRGGSHGGGGEDGGGFPSLSAHPL